MNGLLLITAVVLGQVDGMSSMVKQPASSLVIGVPDAATLKLEDGRTVELMGVEPADTDAAREWLEIYTLDRRITLRHSMHVGYARVRAVPVLWDKMDVSGLMLLNGHGKLSLRGTEPEMMVAKWRGYEARASRLRLGLWARTSGNGTVRIGETVLPFRPAGVLVWPQGGR